MVDIKKSVLAAIETEIAGLDKLLGAIDADWEKALTALSKITGRVIVSGIGKSGHIARKISATLASTGTPAQFVHSAEAAHGDLGMITKTDALLVLSWSGETAELKPVIDYSRRFGVLLIALTSNRDSALGKAADIVLALPDAKEAGSLGIAPTTSTTIQLVAGDALALALLEMKGFDKNHFRSFHPGGSLGAQLKRVGDIMHKDKEVPLCDRETKMADVLLVMSSCAFGCVGVLEGDKLCGIITDGDLRRHINNDLLSKSAASVMTSNPKTIRSDMLASAALELMESTKITALFVVENGKPVGIIHIHDILRQAIV